MGRTIPSFRSVLQMEKERWKPYRNALDKSDRKQFDEPFDIPRLYIIACSIIYSACTTPSNHDIYPLSPLQRAN
jgi:hypothetical protein